MTIIIMLMSFNLSGDLLLNEEILKVLLEFKRLRPYRGSEEERLKKFLWLNEKFNLLFNKNILLLYSKNNPYPFYNPKLQIIVINKLSLISFLHEWAHAIGLLEEEECLLFSTFYFAQVFPHLFRKLRFVNGYWIKGE